MPRDDARQLLDTFGRLVGLDELPLDESGRLAIAVDDDLTVDIEFEDDRDTLLLSADLETLGSEPDAGRLAGMLRANLYFDATAGATLALEGVENRVVLQRAVAVQGSDGASLVGVFEHFVVVAEDWRRRLCRPVGDGADMMIGADRGDPVVGPNVLRV